MDRSHRVLFQPTGRLAKSLAAIGLKVACAPALLASLLAAPPSAHAATITSLNSPWPASPAVQTVDANSVTNSNRAINGTRINRQSFSVPNTIKVDQLYLSASNYGDLSINISFFETATVNSTNLATAQGAQVGSTITVAPFGATATGSRNLVIDFAGAEEITLTGVGGTAGYIMVVQLTNSSDVGTAFNWVHSNTGADIYSGGRLRRDDNDQTNTRDYGLALVAVVPEPSFFAMLAVGGVAFAALRRRRAAV